VHSEKWYSNTYLAFDRDTEDFWFIELPVTMYSHNPIYYYLYLLHLDFLVEIFCTSPNAEMSNSFFHVTSFHVSPRFSRSLLFCISNHMVENVISSASCPTIALTLVTTVCFPVQ
jgi:hypothetical protein